MPSIHSTFRNIRLLVSLLSIGVSTSAFAQVSLEEVKAPILTARQLYFNKVGHDVDVVTQEKGQKEFWSMNQLDAQLQSFRVFWYQDEHLYTEWFILDKGELIYAAEEEKFTPPNHYAQSLWRCEYFIHQERVIDYTSIGHGKTEVDEWDPEEILIQFHRRKAIVEKFSDFEEHGIDLEHFQYKRFNEE